METESNNYRLLSLLIGYDEFQTYVKSVRKFLRIPTTGFADSKDVGKWTYARDKKDAEYLNSDEYKKHNRNIRAKLAKKEIDIDMANMQLHLLDENLHCNFFTSACRYIVDKFNLPGHLYHPLRYYILYNKLVFVPSENFAYIPDVNEDHMATITVHSKLTQKEEKLLLNFIRQQTKDFPKINTISKTTMRQISFEDWQKNRANYSEKITAKDIAKEHLGSGKQRHKVYDAKRDLEDKRKKLFG